MTTLSGHQPCYLPSLQLFAKMAKSDIFMPCGHLQFKSGSWHNKNYIWLRDKRYPLTIPIQGPSGRSIREARFANNYWKKDHLETIALAYGPCRFFDDYYPTIKEIIYSHPHSLERLNIELTTVIASWLGIKTALIDSGRWDFTGNAVDKIIQMCAAVGADTYLSNEGAAEYLGMPEEERLQRKGVKHEWLNFKDPDEEPLSAIHHLSSLGPEAARLIQ